MKYEALALPGPVFRGAVVDPAGRTIAWTSCYGDAQVIAEQLSALAAEAH